MNLKEILYTLSEVGIHSPQNYFTDYLVKEKEILNGIEKLDGIKSSFYLTRNNLDLASSVRFALIFSDYINFIPISLSKFKFHFPIFGDSHIDRKSIDLNIPDNIVKKILEFSSKPELIPAYLDLDNEQILNFTKSLKPFFERGCLLYRPSRIIMTVKVDFPRESHIIFYHVNPDSPYTNWDLIDEPEIQFSIPLLSDTYEDYDNYIFELTIPYLDKIELTELNRILIDEQDIISDFRIELKKITKQAFINKSELIEIKEDILRPRIDKINRKFKSIQNMRTLKNSGVVLSSGLLALTSLFTNGITSAVSKTLGIIGSGGIFANEVDYKKNIENLKDDSLYLLWKIGRKSH